jgi:hypothetical protein
MEEINDNSNEHTMINVTIAIIKNLLVRYMYISVADA